MFPSSEMKLSLLSKQQGNTGLRGSCEDRSWTDPLDVFRGLQTSKACMHSNGVLEDSAATKWAHRTCCHNPTRRDLGWKPIFLALTGSDEAVMMLKT